MADVLELERVEMMPMPSAFDGYVERTVRVSSTCLISVARNRYSVPCELVGQWASSRLYPSRVVVVADETTIASHERLFDRDQVSYDWQHYMPLIALKLPDSSTSSTATKTESRPVMGTAAKTWVMTRSPFT